MNMYNKLSVDGYQFYSEKDAKLAEAEQQKIEYLEARIDYSKPASVLVVYQKLIQERVFKTPVGLQYLKKIQGFLKENNDNNEMDIPDIQLYFNYSGEVRDRVTNVHNRIMHTQKKKDEEKQKLIISYILNIMLVIAMIAMLIITVNSDNPNIMNYEKVLTNRYASWEQELTEREEVIRQKEKELSIKEWGN